MLFFGLLGRRVLCESAAEERRSQRAGERTNECARERGESNALDVGRFVTFVAQLHSPPNAWTTGVVTRLYDRQLATSSIHGHRDTG